MSAGPERWGWHRLDPDWASRLVRRAGVAPGDLVLDIGAGRGAITRPLLDAGARVVAIELHEGRARSLRTELAGRDLVVVRTDAADLRLPRRGFKVVANPPFGVTAAVLRRLLHPASRLERAELVLPWWACVRWATGRGLGGLASSRRFELGLGPRVPPRAFHPPPPSPAGVLSIHRRRG
ncbi:MAG: rRNA adenine N-6-methyltransferase family protein [Acidimicrobiia bacterium]